MPADQCEEDDDAALERAVEEACKVILVRTGGKGLHVLPPCNISSVMAPVQRVVGAALLYTWGGKQKNEATEAEVEEWVRRWKRGEEKRALVTDREVSRGWEAKEVLAIGSEVGRENLVMRSCGFCFLIELE